jgi:hypothetical protein
LFPDRSINQSLVELAELDPSSTNPISAIEKKQEQKQEAKNESPQFIVEANAISRDSDGKLRLIADSNPLSPAIPSLSCAK